MDTPRKPVQIVKRKKIKKKCWEKRAGIFVEVERNKEKEQENEGPEEGWKMPAPPIKNPPVKQRSVNSPFRRLKEMGLELRGKSISERRLILQRSVRAGFLCDGRIGVDEDKPKYSSHDQEARLQGDLDALLRWKSRPNSLKEANNPNGKQDGARPEQMQKDTENKPTSSPPQPTAKELKDELTRELMERKKRRREHALIAMGALERIDNLESQDRQASHNDGFGRGFRRELFSEGEVSGEKGPDNNHETETQPGEVAEAEDENISEQQTAESSSKILTKETTEAPPSPNYWDWFKEDSNRIFDDTFAPLDNSFMDGQLPNYSFFGSGLQFPFSNQFEDERDPPVFPLVTDVDPGRSPDPFAPMPDQSMFEITFTQPHDKSKIDTDPDTNTLTVSSDAGPINREPERALPQLSSSSSSSGSMSELSVPDVMSNRHSPVLRWLAACSEVNPETPQYSTEEQPESLIQFQDSTNDGTEPFQFRQNDQLDPSTQQPPCLTRSYPPTTWGLNNEFVTGDVRMNPAPIVDQGLHYKQLNHGKLDEDRDRNSNYFNIVNRNEEITPYLNSGTTCPQLNSNTNVTYSLLNMNRPRPAFQSCYPTNHSDPNGRPYPTSGIYTTSNPYPYSHHDSSRPHTNSRPYPTRWADLTGQQYVTGNPCPNVNPRPTSNPYPSARPWSCSNPCPPVNPRPTSNPYPSARPWSCSNPCPPVNPCPIVNPYPTAPQWPTVNPYSTERSWPTENPRPFSNQRLIPPKRQYLTVRPCPIVPPLIPASQSPPGPSSAYRPSYTCLSSRTSCPSATHRPPYTDRPYAPGRQTSTDRPSSKQQTASSSRQSRNDCPSSTVLPASAGRPRPIIRPCPTFNSSYPDTSLDESSSCSVNVTVDSLSYSPSYPRKTGTDEKIRSVYERHMSKTEFRAYDRKK